MIDVKDCVQVNQQSAPYHYFATSSGRCGDTCGSDPRTCASHNLLSLYQLHLLDTYVIVLGSQSPDKQAIHTHVKLECYCRSSLIIQHTRRYLLDSKQVTTLIANASSKRSMQVSIEKKNFMTLYRSQIQECLPSSRPSATCPLLTYSLSPIS